jgi:anti-sigma regulatory factor (Ser/Thr protein kinase)
LPFPDRVVDGRGVADLEYAVELPPATTTPALVRRTLTWMLVDWPAEAVERTRAAASELLTNAVVHGDLRPGHDSLIVSMLVRGDTVRVSVQQPTAVPELVERPQGEGRSGIGLTIVSALADDWGFRREAPGRVWFEVDRSRERAPI